MKLSIVEKLINSGLKTGGKGRELLSFIGRIWLTFSVSFSYLVYLKLLCKF